MAITARLMTYTTTKRRHFRAIDLLMRTRAYKTGFTLIEMVLVVAIIAILISMVVRVTKRIDDQSKERLCQEHHHTDRHRPRTVPRLRI